jgi:exodeoxyribonuclease-3
MKLVSWNVNSVRARQQRMTAWVAANAPDVLCLQELKVETENFPSEALDGYHVAAWGQRSYNGVAIAARQPLSDVTRGFGDGGDDEQARVIAATVAGTRVVCVYVPNGQELGSQAFAYKLDWLGRLRRYLDRVAKPTDPLVLCGDMNVTPDDRDVHDPEAWRGRIHTTDEERAALRGVVEHGLTDVFRHHHGDQRAWSWWDYRGVDFFKDRGLRIDVVYASAPLIARSRDCRIDREARKGKDASDHAPVIWDVADIS